MALDAVAVGLYANVCVVVVTFVSVLFKISCTKRQSRCCTFCSQIISL